VTGDSVDFGYAAPWKRRYSEVWYSSRACVEAFERAAIRYAQVPVAFAAAGTETAVTVGQIHCTAEAVAAGMQRLGIRPATRWRSS
jgi:hypothetical protein